MIRKINLPKQQMRALIGPESINKEKRTIDLIWTTGSKGLRSGWDGSYYEALSMDTKHVRMDRLTSGSAPLINNHDTWNGLKSVIGVVENARIKGDEGHATVRFADTADVADIWRKIETGILKNVSVGYSVYKYERQPMSDKEETPTYLATDWEPTEISIVPVGFDERAVVRAEEALLPCEIINNHVEREVTQVKKQVEPQNAGGDEGDVAAVATAPVLVDEKKIADEARTAEKIRQMEIRKIVGGVKLPAQFADSLIEKDSSLEQARALILEELTRESEKLPHFNANSSITEGKPNQQATRAAGITNALLNRAKPDKVKLSDSGREFRGMSLLELAKDCLSAAGVNTRGLTKMQVCDRAFQTTSDFPELLSNTASISLKQGYDEAPQTFKLWASQHNLPDFKSTTVLSAGEAPALLPVTEANEIKYGALGESAEKYKLATFGRIIALSRQVIIDDNVGAFTTVASKFGASAAALESDLVYGILTANPIMADGYALFSSQHKNLGTAGALALGTLSGLRLLQRKMKNVNGDRTLNIMGKYLLLPATLETIGLQLLSNEIVANDQTKINPYRNSTIPIVEGRLDDSSSTAYYMVADPSIIEGVVYGYLDGQEGVYTESRQGFNIDGVEIKARLDFAAAVVDYRGLAKNVGA